jgi:transposase InsO family protein
VIDLHSRRLAGWAIAEHMRTDLVVDALNAAARTRGSLDGAIFHSDHGAQYTSKDFAATCKAAGVRQSMSAVGSSADNALAESFNATFKRETLQGRRAFAGRLLDGEELALRQQIGRILQQLREFLPGYRSLPTVQLEEQVRRHTNGQPTMGRAPSRARVEA